MSGKIDEIKIDYQQYANDRIPKNNKVKNYILAFLFGGAICVIGQLISEAGIHIMGLEEEQTSMFTSVVLIFIAALLTGLGVYDVIGKHAGAGSMVPITGFANSIVAPAMEFKREGPVMGVGSKLFTLAGPVLVMGITLSVIAGVIYYFIGLIW
ncbi:MAG: stage V sporulation protein AC [Christensenellales bacterium]|jgi:stage V sporulation protein AC